MTPEDQKYMKVLLTPVRVCAKYKPAFGQSGNNGTNLSEFQTLYGSDPFYHWVGLDSELMYAAHKAAGGMTSVYRQLGVGCERLFRAIAADKMELTDEQLAWGYDVKNSEGEVNRLTLDARLDVEHLTGERRERLAQWVAACARELSIDEKRVDSFRGAVFEIRQGYKSADSKRQNADLRSALRAMNENYLFVICVFSSQINQMVLRRYRNAQMLALVGSLKGSSSQSTFAFCEQVLGYSLIDFFSRNSVAIRAEVEAVLQQLLQAE